MISNFFVNSSVIVNRAPTVEASEVLNDVVASGNCRTCRQCNVTCNK